METKNMVVLVGRLTADPELRFIPNGTAVTSFALAVNRSFRKDDGEFGEKLDGFFDCEHFGRTAEKFAIDFKKGDLVQITGSLHQSKYMVGTKPNERTVSKIEVKAQTIASVLVAPKAKAEASAPAEAQPAELQPA